MLRAQRGSHITTLAQERTIRLHGPFGSSNFDTARPQKVYVSYPPCWWVAHLRQHFQTLTKGLEKGSRVVSRGSAMLQAP